MPPIVTRKGDLYDGIPSNETQDFAAAHLDIVTGSTPSILAMEQVVLTGATLALHTVVGLDGSGLLVAAVAGTVAPIGVLMVEVETAPADSAAVVWRAGCFDPNQLVWDASYSTDALKRNAFEGAPSPTQVVMRPRQELDLS